MADLNYLYKKLNDCKKKIEKEEDALKKDKKELSALEEFLGNVSAAYASYSQAIYNRQTLMSDLDEVTTYCKCAEEYREGMDYCLSGIGIKGISKTGPDKKSARKIVLS